MPVLENPKHELLAQELAKGTSATEAYAAAGFKPNRHNAAALARQQHISARVREILIEGAALTALEVLQELSRIASADIRKAVRWNGAEVEDEADGRVRAQNTVLLVNSDELDDDTAACISEVTQTKDGLKIKFHDKLGALDKLARAHGLYKETVTHRHVLTLEQLVIESRKDPAGAGPPAIEGAVAIQRERPAS